MYLKSLAKSVEKDRERKDYLLRGWDVWIVVGIVTVLPREPWQTKNLIAPGTQEK